jgi:uncharacterized protein YjbI with pentapeptide repeats
MQEPTGKIQRLLKVQARLRSAWELRNEKLTELAKGLAIENDPATKFKLEKQVRDEEAEILELERKLEAIELALDAGEIPVTIDELFPEITVDETNPYQGLFAFTPETAKFFFGRNKEIKKLEEKVKDCNFVPVIGASGSGKSSLVRAGLIPRLLTLGWQVLPPIKPGSEPLKTLKLLVGELFEIAEREQIDRILEQQGLGSIASRLPGEGRVLLVVDQFEEVFTQCQDRQERQRFIDCLTSVRQSDNRRLVVVTTMRADFVERCLTSGMLTQEILDDVSFLFVLAGANLEDAIEQPSAIQGYNLQPGLLELILRDVANEENCLPLLEFALTELWEKRDRSNQLLTVAEYQGLGGLVGALDRHAEEIYQDLAARGQGEWVQRVMLRLVRTGEGMRDTRQRRSQVELLDMGKDAATREKIEKTIDKLVDGRLLTIDRVNGENVIDLSHEALMQGWKSFVKWREIDRDLRRLVDKIEEARRDWLVKKQQGKYLLEGRLLGDAKRLLKDRSEALLGEVRSFVIKSLEHQKRRRIQSAGWLLVPVFVLGLPAEYFWREEVVKQDYHRIENTKGTAEERLAVLNLAGGCYSKRQYSWMPTYFRERVFGNCRSLDEVNLNGASLDNVNLSGASLYHANLSGASLYSANLSSTNLQIANLSGASLYSANLSGVAGSDVNLSGAALNGVNLSGANLLIANLSGASLGGVNLTHTFLHGVNLSGADLDRANFSGAALNGVNLSRAKLGNAHLKNVRFECDGASSCINMENIISNEHTNWEGIDGWKNVKNIPHKLKKQLNLP